MKREGRQRGTMVRKGKEIITINTSGDDSRKVVLQCPLKPCNHSKYTGKCRKARCTHCHLHPVSKSRDKAKGSYKLKSSDVVLNHRLLTWRVVAVGPTVAGGSSSNAHDWSKYSGASASGILDALSTNTDSFYSSEGTDIDQEEDQEYNYEGHHFAEEGEGHDNADNNKEEGEEEEGDDMGFFEVGLVWEYIDEEGWCVVGEMI